MTRVGRCSGANQDSSGTTQGLLRLKQRQIRNTHEKGNSESRDWNCVFCCFWHARLNLPLATKETHRPSEPILSPSAGGCPGWPPFHCHACQTLLPAATAACTCPLVFLNEVARHFHRPQARPRIHTATPRLSAAGLVPHRRHGREPWACRLP